MTLYYTGVITNYELLEEYETLKKRDVFTKIPNRSHITDVNLDFEYMIFWKGEKPYFSGPNRNTGEPATYDFFKDIPGKITSVATCPNFIMIATDKKEIWRFNLLTDELMKYQTIKYREGEDIAKIAINLYSLIILTTLGSAITISTEIRGMERLNTDEKSNIPLVCSDVAMGINHILLLDCDGRVYAFGSGERAVLGHRSLKMLMYPKVIKALLGVKITKIAACGWLSAALSDKGDLYLWGWNKFGEIEPLNENRDNRLFPVPLLVKIKNENGEELKVKEIQCGSFHIIVLTEDGTFWGRGSNKYGQLGKLEVELEDDTCTRGFVKLDMSWLEGRKVKKFVCEYSSSVMIVE